MKSLFYKVHISLYHIYNKKNIFLNICQIREPSSLPQLPGFPASKTLREETKQLCFFIYNAKIIVKNKNITLDNNQELSFYEIANCTL